jgi:hypothetical protein
MLTYFQLLPKPPGLPLSVDFINDGYYRSYNPSTKMLDVIPLPRPYDKGFTNAIYRALNLTNLPSGDSIPAAFVFVWYSPFGGVPFERLRAQGVITRVSSKVERALEAPRFDGVAHVADYRVKGSGLTARTDVPFPYFGYPITNATWLDTNAVAAVRAKAEERLRRQEMITKLDREKTGSVRLAVVSALVVVMILSAWIFRRAMQQKSTTELVNATKQ